MTLNTRSLKVTQTMYEFILVYITK